MQINYILLGQRIRAIRTKKGITQMELAERIDRSPAYMSYVETAYKFCSLDTLVRVANELNVSTDDLLIDSLANTFSGVCEYIFVNAKTMTKMADILMIGKVALCNDLLYR